jgi:2-succinyl-6-hydroxy-2,4-cyclohexadiene-1-carboxylate synthase
MASDDRATVVLLHGFTHTGASWQPVIAGMAESYRALAPDIRGHGEASARQPVSLEAVLGDVGALALGRFTLVGYSMGGRIALHAALAFPERVSRLILIGASPGIADPEERRARRASDERLADEIEVLTIAQFARRWARTPVLAGQPPAVAAAAHADRLRSEPAGLARALRALGTAALPPLWNRLSELAMPVCLIAGERDAKFREIANRMALGIRDGSVEVVADCGHAVHLESPSAVVAAF